MSMPFSRPGAIDLSGLKRPSPAAAVGPLGGPGVPGSGGPGAGSPSAAVYVLEVDEQNFQALLEASLTAPVILVVYSPTRLPVSVQLADDLETLAGELQGRIAVGRVNVDAQPTIASALRVQAIPLVALVVQGQLQPLFQDAPPLDELRALMPQLLDQLATQGMAGQHQPFGAPVEEVTEEEADPRYGPAEDALIRGDLDAAVAEYQQLLVENPADTEASLGLARAQLMQRTAGVDLGAARAAAAAAPDDIDAQLLVADLDLLGGHVEDAFQRLIELVRRSAGPERDRVRLHLIDLFAVIGNDDARVLTGRRNLASALF